MAKVCEKVYLDGDGNEHRSASTEAKALAFRFANGQEVTVDLSKFPKDIISAAAWHGVAQKIGDSYAGSETVDEAVERAQTMLENLEGGTWVATRTAAGPRPSLLVDAIVAAKQEAGQEVDPVAVAQKLKDQPDLKKNALQNAAIKMHYDKIKAERAAAKAKESAKEAKGAEADLSAF